MGIILSHNLVWFSLVHGVIVVGEHDLRSSTVHIPTMVAYSVVVQVVNKFMFILQ